MGLIRLLCDKEIEKSKKGNWNCIKWVTVQSKFPLHNGYWHVLRKRKGEMRKILWYMVVPFRNSSLSLTFTSFRLIKTSFIQILVRNTSFNSSSTITFSFCFFYSFCWYSEFFHCFSFDSREFFEFVFLTRYARIFC